MDITCTPNESGQFICSIPFPQEGDIIYNNILSPELSIIFVLMTIWFFAWSLERIFYYLINRVKKAKYDS
jgi:hypothetical protein